jgi:hypothetical protein
VEKESLRITGLMIKYSRISSFHRTPEDGSRAKLRKVMVLIKNKRLFIHFSVVIRIFHMCATGPDYPS